MLTSFIASKPDCEVNILSTFPGEAARIRDNIPEEGIRCANDLGPDTYGKPIKISDKPEEVAPGADVIILAIPSFAHELYLRAVAPYVKPGVVIGAMPGEGGFDLCARHVLGNEFVEQSNVFALETLPWACRIMVSNFALTFGLGDIVYVAVVHDLIFRLLPIDSPLTRFNHFLNPKSTFRNTENLPKSWEPRKKSTSLLPKAKSRVPNRCRSFCSTSLERYLNSKWHATFWQSL